MASMVGGANNATFCWDGHILEPDVLLNNVSFDGRQADFRVLLVSQLLANNQPTDNWPRFSSTFAHFENPPYAPTFFAFAPSGIASLPTASRENRMTTASIQHYTVIHDGYRAPNEVSVSDELRKVVVMAAAFFFIAIVCVLSKLQFAAGVVMRWSPILWLLGICIGVGLMNGIFYVREKRRQRKRQLRLDRSVILALPISRSFPCLSPGPHSQNCNRVPTSHRHLDSQLPTYDDVLQEEKSHEENQLPSYATAIAMLTPQDV
ncbi:unnamed protein product [Caenorhabditis auriculariae]|uniref:Uncharacterized protein n=1 Tax=Caenorhabditis auriculariae TaxID=2777116 RepID=A0A8S1H7C4_9PELO|nr:unnamed protein product [Caenorhabditis auriculariae]